MTDVRIPEPARTAVVGQAITGTLLVGQSIPGDTYVDYPLGLDGGAATLSVGVLIQPSTGTLELPQGTAEVIVAIVDDEIIQVDVTGYLDEIGGPAEVTTTKQAIVVVTATGELSLPADTAVVTTERNVVLVATDQPLDLDGGPVRLVIEVILRIAVDAVIPLDLFGGPVHVNPVLMPSDCLDLDLGSVTVTDIDLTASACEPLDLAALVCLDEEWTPLPEPEVLEPEPVGCLDA